MTMNIKANPLWTENDAPQFLSRTDTVYSQVPIRELWQRGIEGNRLYDSLISFLPDGAYIAGGFMSSLLQEDKKATDIDFFFNGPETFAKVFDMLMSPPEDDDAWGWRGYTLDTELKGFDSERYLRNIGKPVAEPYEIAKDVRFVRFKHATLPPIQLIKLVWYTGPEHVIDSFDLTVSQVVSTNVHIHMHPLAPMDIQRKRIVLHRMQFPASTLRRVIKYTSKGYYACAGSLGRISEAIGKFMADPKGQPPEQYFYVD